MKITIKEDTIIITFFDLGINKNIKKVLVENDITTPTPVQEQAIPHILDGKDCLAEAPTGTGKTFAFGIPAIEKVDTQNPAVQIVILCPTRELAMQSERELKKLATYVPQIKILAIYGGQPIERQLAMLRRKPQIIVGTPGRVMDHIRRRTLRLQNVKMIILDEADEMLNMGFRDDIDTVLSAMPRPISTQLFSATMPKEILEISKNYQTEPIYIKTQCANSELPNIAQYYIKTAENKKFDTFRAIMSQKDYKFVLIFCNTKRKVDALNAKLTQHNYLSMALHGDLRQRQRDAVMRSYRDKKINILVATDVAARGIDVANIEAVFNYDLPSNDDYYVHRIGRTARANTDGVAYTFATPKEERLIRHLEKIVGAKMEELVITDQKIATKEIKKTPNMVRYFVNVGEKDGASNKLIIQFINKNAKITADCIGDIKILDLFSFIEINQHCADAMFALNGKKFGGRKVAVETATPSHKDKKQYGAKSENRRQSKGKFTRKVVSAENNFNHKKSNEESNFNHKKNNFDGNYPQSNKKAAYGGAKYKGKNTKKGGYNCAGNNYGKNTESASDRQDKNHDLSSKGFDKPKKYGQTSKSKGYKSYNTIGKNSNKSNDFGSFAKQGKRYKKSKNAKSYGKK